MLIELCIPTLTVTSAFIVIAHSTDGERENNVTWNLVSTYLLNSPLLSFT